MTWLFQPLLLTSGLVTEAVGAAAGIGAASAVGAEVTGTPDAWNIADKSANVTLSNSDKTAILSSSVTAGVRSTQHRTSGAVGKFYVEFVINAANPFGVQVGFSSTAQSVTATTDAIRVNVDDGTIFFGASIIGDAWTAEDGAGADGDVICLAWDTSAKRVWARLNSLDWNDNASADPATGVGGELANTPNAVDYALWMRASNSGRGAILRTEAAEFTYSGPSGFTSWMGEALGSATSDAVGDADGVGTAAATSEAIKEVVGTAAGAATATGASPSATTDAVGAASGVGAATAVGEAFTGIPDAWSAADKSANITLSNNDKTATLSAAVTSGVRSTTKYLNGTEAQKFYVEFLLTNVVGSISSQVGLREVSASLTSTAGSTAQCASNSGNILTGNATVIGNVGGSPLVDGDIVCMAWSPSTEQIWFRKNSNNWNNDAAANPATDTNGLDISVLNNTNHALFFLIASTGNGAITTVRTELADLSYTVPSGFTSWMGEALATSDAVGTAAGVGTASAPGEQVRPAQGTASGIGVAAATGQQVATVSAAASGIGTAAASSAQIAAASSAVSGIGAAAADGRGLATVAGAVSGVGAASAGSAQIAAASGTLSGVGAASASSSSEAYVSGAGAAPGIGAATASSAQIAAAASAAAGVGSATSSGVAIASGVASAAGVGAASATGGKIATAQGAAPALGVASGSSSAAAYVSGVGAAAGVGTAAATGVAASAAAAGTAAGLGAAAATGYKIATAAGAVVGTGTATATSGAIAATAGTASGIGSAAAEGFESAVVFEEAAGSANGVGATSGIGFAIQPSATADTRIIVAAAELRVITAAAETRTITPSAENRTIVAVAEDRTIEAVVEDRDIETSEIQRSLAA